MILGIPIGFLLAWILFPKYMAIGSVIVCLLAAPLLLVISLFDGLSALVPKPKPRPPDFRDPVFELYFDKWRHQSRLYQWRQEAGRCCDRRLV